MPSDENPPVAGNITGALRMDKKLTYGEQNFRPLAGNETVALRLHKKNNKKTRLCRGTLYTVHTGALHPEMKTRLHRAMPQMLHASTKHSNMTGALPAAGNKTGATRLIEAASLMKIRLRRAI